MAGRASATVAAGRASAAAPASPTRASRSEAPRTNERCASTPATPASRSVPSSTLPMRIGLSAVPNCAIAHSLTGVGVRSMTVDPTASTGEAAGLSNAATR